MHIQIWIDIAGWIGVGLLLIAYGLVSARRLNGDSIRYQLMNMTGGSLLVINSFYFGAYPSVGVNLAWISIALVVLIKNARLSTQITGDKSTIPAE